MFASPEIKEETNLNQYLMNCNLTKNNTEDNSFDALNHHRESKESLLHPHWSTYKNHPVTSRINTCPRFERDRNEVTSSRNSSNIIVIE